MEDYSSEDDNNNIIIDNEQNNHNQNIDEYKSVVAKELPNLCIVESRIKELFNAYKGCAWYEELINSITLVKRYLSKDVSDYNSYAKFIRLQVYKIPPYFEATILLPVMLLQYGHVLTSEQFKQLGELANLFKRVYNAIMSFLFLKHENVLQGGLPLAELKFIDITGNDTRRHAEEEFDNRPNGGN